VALGSRWRPETEDFSEERSLVRACAAVIAAVLVIGLLVADANARGRTGSFRVGGYTSHGKASHYVGGQ
jgi:hypothetical protein